jgi:glutamyl-tRNA reductase
MMTFGYYEGDPLVAEQQDKLANIAREDLQRERKEVERFREAEYKANEELNEFAQSLKTTKSTEDIAEKSLRWAETGIKSLQASMQSAVNVWDKLHEQCDSISNQGNHKLIGKLMRKKTAEEGKEFWSSPTFKKQAMKFYARYDS